MASSPPFLSESGYVRAIVVIVRGSGGATGLTEINVNILININSADTAF